MTDEVDSLLIAEFASKNDLRLYKPKDPVIKELRALYKCSQNLKSQKVQAINYLENEESLPKSVKSIYKKLVKNLQKEILDIDKKIELLLTRSETLSQDCTNLQSIPGIGKITAVAILSKAPDINDLHDARQLAAFAGLNPRHRTSGTSLKGRSRLSKMGSPILRKALYFPAITAKNHSAIFKSFSQKLASKGKHTMVIIGQ